MQTSAEFSFTLTLYCALVLAQPALEGLLPGVGPEMPGEVGLGLERGGAVREGADERAVARVGAQVHRQLGPVPGPVRAHLAPEGPLPAVHPEVLLQGAGLAAGVVALAAPERLLVSVDPLVEADLVLAGEALRTERAGKGLLS